MEKVKTGNEANNFYPIKNTDKEIKALSWKQPFASAMLFGKIETRVWPTKYRGLVLICASLQPYKRGTMIVNICGHDLYKKMMLKIGSHETLTNEFNGHAIAVGRLVDCRPMKKEDEAKTFVQFNPALYCHIYEDVRAIKPFRWKGVQGWKRLTDVDIEKIEFLNT